jgi:hypothetical protein
MMPLSFFGNSKYLSDLSQDVPGDGHNLIGAQAGFLRGKYVHSKIGPDTTFLAQLGNVYLPGILE